MERMEWESVRNWTIRLVLDKRCGIDHDISPVVCTGSNVVVARRHSHSACYCSAISILKFTKTFSTTVSYHDRVDGTHRTQCAESEYHAAIRAVFYREAGASANYRYTLLAGFAGALS